MTTGTRTKTDTQLQHDVLAELEFEPAIDAARIGVAAHNGVVTLSGEVASYFERRKAVEAAERVFGVSAIADELETRWERQDKPADTDIAGLAKSALAAHFGVPVGRVQVLVHDGRITLEGEVNWQFQRRAAERAVESLRGVRSVTNSIRLAQHRVDATDVKRKIEAAFERHADIDAARILVKTENGTVILEGSVPTWHEKQEAETAAWSARETVSVDNRIRVVPRLD